MHNSNFSLTNIEHLSSISNLDIPRLNSVYGHISVLGSKSISNRALLLASICSGITKIHNLLHSDDTKVMLNALKILGVELSVDNIDSNVINVNGSNGYYSVKQADLFMGNAGTAIRPLTSMLAFMNGEYTLQGVKRMHERPIKDLVDGLIMLGANIKYLNNAGYPPIKINPPNINLDKDIFIKGNVSSQFVSSLLMSLPIINYQSNIAQDIRINIDGELISKPYVYLTIEVMKNFGVNVIHNLANNNGNYLIVPKESKYISPQDFYVEGDASSASYMIAAGVIAASEDGLTIDNIGKNSIQGDIKFVDAIRKMGANINQKDTSTIAYKSILHGAEIDCLEIPDAAMTLAIVALFANSPTTLLNIASWKVKETDRILAMYNELSKLGAKVDYSNNHIKITPPHLYNGWIQPQNGIDTYDDHRMAMCFSLCAFSDKLNGIKINEPACISKTYPEFFTHLFSILNK